MIRTRISFHQGRHLRYCHSCGQRLIDGELFVLVTRRPRRIKTRMYSTTEPRVPLYYHDECYEDGK